MLYIFFYFFNIYCLPKCISGLCENSISWYKQNFITCEKRGLIRACGLLEMIFGSIFVGLQIGANIQRAPMYDVQVG